MAKLTYDVSGVEKEPALPKPNVYKVKIVSCVDAKPQNKNRRLEVQYEIIDGDSKGYKLRDWIQVDNTEMDWMLAQFIRALGLNDKGSLDPAKLVGKTLFVRTTVQNDDEWGPQARVRQRLSSEDADDADTGDDDEDLSEDEDAEGDDDDEDNEDWTDEELKELSVDELIEAAQELEVDTDELLKGKKKAVQKKSALTAAILAAQEAVDEEDEDDEGDEDGDEELWTEAELQELDTKELKEVAGEYEDVTVPGKMTSKAKATLIAAILEAQGGEGDDEDADDDTPDYAAMDLDELKAECKKRDLPTKGTKSILVRRLEKDDEQPV